MHPNHAIQFAFQDEHDAAMAYATLNELGYLPVKNGDHVHIHLERGDLTSALEIAMAHGGQLCSQAALQEESMLEGAYDMNAIPIPAHTVNEDWADAYAMEASEELGHAPQAQLRNRDEAGADDGLFDPDDRSYGFFSGDVRA
jgi:hypothetical protein